MTTRKSSLVDRSIHVKIANINFHLAASNNIWFYQESTSLHLTQMGFKNVWLNKSEFLVGFGIFLAVDDFFVDFVLFGTAGLHFTHKRYNTFSSNFWRFYGKHEFRSLSSINDDDGWFACIDFDVVSQSIVVFGWGLSEDGCTSMLVKMRDFPCSTLTVWAACSKMSFKASPASADWKRITPTALSPKISPIVLSLNW